MVEFITGASGTGKTTAMFEKIKNSTDTENIAIVPEQYSTEFDKKLYSYIGAKAFNEMLSLSFSSLARQLFQLFGEPGRNGEFADDMARLIIIFQAVEAARNNPEQMKYFSKSSRQTGFSEEALKLIGDMKKAGIRPQTLMLGAEKLDSQLRDKVSDIASVFYEYEFLMEQYGFKDHLDNIREASKAANLNNYFSGKRVFIDEFESFTGDQIDMLKVIISSAKDVVITLRTDDVYAERFTLFETVNNTFLNLERICRELNTEIRITKCEKSLRFRNDDLRYLSERVMRNYPADRKNSPKAENIRIFEARDMYSEAEYVCAEIIHRIYADSTLKFNDIAVISNNIEDYAAVLKAAFDRYDIPYFMSIEQPVSHTAVMVYFLSLLDLLTARTIKSEQVFRFLKCELPGVDLTEISELENYCYKWNVDGNMWFSKFTADDEAAETAEKIRVNHILPIIRLRKKLSEKKTASEICTLLYKYMTQTKADENLSILIDRLIKNDSDNEAAELKRLWGCLMDILDSAAETLGETETEFAEFADIFRSMVGQISYSVPPRTLDAVTAASARTARLSETRIIFVMGACEGDLPNQVSLHGLFSDSDKQKLAQNGIEIARPLTDLIASERLIVYKALSTASEKLYLSYPLSDLSGQAKYPAHITEQICEMFSNGNEAVIKETELTPFFYAVTKKSAYYHFMQNRSDNTAETASIQKTLLEDEEYSRKFALALSKTEQNPNYKISSDIMEELVCFTPLYLSPSALERYNRCHFMHFCESLVKLKMPEKIDLDRRITGELTHNCFFNILAKRSKAEFLEMSAEQLQDEINSEAEKYRNEKMAGDFGKTPRFELYFKKLTERLGDVFLHTKHSLMQSDFVPDSFEMKIGGEQKISVAYGEGRELVFGGIVDRADVCTVEDEKYFRIVDYKSSKKVIDENTLAGGVDLQMLLYMFALSENGGKYEDYTPAGVLYTPLEVSKIEIDSSKIEEYNQTAVDSQLKTTGLLTDRIKVLEKMEHGLGGKYIPAKLTKEGTFDKRYTTVVSQSGMEKLREYVYGCLGEAAEKIHSGDIEAVPLKIKKKTSCKYCIYFNVCGNSGNTCREPDAEKIREAAAILGKEV